MTTATKKKKLQAIIEDSDDKLISLLYALAKEYNVEEDDNIKFSDEEIQMFEDDRVEYLKGAGTYYSQEETINRMKSSASIKK